MVIGGSAQDADPWDVPEIMGESGGSSYGFSLENGTWVNGILTLQLPEGAVTDLAGNPVQASNVITIILDATSPRTSAPWVSLRSDTTLGSGYLRAVLNWTGTDLGPAGIAFYDVAGSVDGSPFRVIATSLTTPGLWANLRPGHSYRFEVRARDKAGNVGSWTRGSTLTPALYQQTSPAVHFVGPSKTISRSAFSGGSQRYLGATGASATFQTSARSLSFVTTRGPGRGSVAIYIDGALRATIDLSAATTTYRYVAFSTRWSAVGTHRIKVVAVGGGRVDVDAFGVIR